MLALLGLAVPPVAPAEGPPAPDPAAVAERVCKAELEQAGEAAFVEKYGSLRACVEQKLAGARTGERAPAELVAQVANALCRAALEKYGEERFTEKFGSHEQCVSKVRERAQGLAKAAQAKCKEAGDRRACVERVVKALVGDGAHKGDHRSEEAAKRLVKAMAAALCERLEARLGEQEFAELFDSQAECAATLRAKAAKLAKAAAERCRAADDREACLEAAVRAARRK